MLCLLVIQYSNKKALILLIISAKNENGVLMGLEYVVL